MTDAACQTRQHIRLLKQSLNSAGIVHWGERLAVLSQAYLTFYEADNKTVEIDRIPLVEIGKISSKYLENAGIEIGDPFETGRSLGERGGRRRSADNMKKPVALDTHDMTFLIRTVPGGRNCGRNYTLCCADAGDFWDFVNTLNDAILDAKKWHEDQLLAATIGTSGLAKLRHRTNEWYESTGPQVLADALAHVRQLMP